jgi:sensor histidine kinase YesM
LRASFLNRLVIHSRFNIPIYWAIVSIVHALAYYTRSQERERKALELENRLADAKLQALRMQLHPHFLFNTLNAISTLVHKDPQAADEMIGNLSELLRATLDTTEQEIPLRQELGLLERYLEIQQARFGERLRIEKEIEPAALEGRVPTLILQPLVENAIRHGIEPQPGPGVVGIRAQRNGERLELAVRDSGTGIKASAKAPEGIGLANTKARLQQLYGQSARLVLNRAAKGGCSVEIELPFREKAHSGEQVDSERGNAGTTELRTPKEEPA